MANETQTNPRAAAETEPLTAEEAVRVLRALRARFPMPVPTTAPLALRRRLAHVDAAFVQASVNAVGTSGGVQQLLGRSDEDLRLEIDAAMRWSAVTDELLSFHQLSADANTIRRQRIGLTALQTYQICRQLARDENYAQLRPHIDEMRRLNKFGRVRRKPAAPVPETAVKK